MLKNSLYSHPQNIKMKKVTTAQKSGLHPRNNYKNHYDFKQLSLSNTDLAQFVFTNEHQIESIDFSIPEAVKALNKAILIADFDIQNWDIPTDYLCPPIPGRTDYLHYIADLLGHDNNDIIPLGENTIGLDIGVGANCIYPILGNKIYGWQFVGTDTDEVAIENCEKIITSNPELIDFISLQLQVESRFIFKNIIQTEDKFAFTICNPPFHSSADEAAKAAIRKVNALQNVRTTNPILNFGGQNSELWTAGGELGFVTQMIFESKKYPLQVMWFTTLVSKKENLSSLHKTLTKAEAVKIETINMAQGHKTSRILAWTFLTEKQRNEWEFAAV